jgi:hypothetical protein
VQALKCARHVLISDDVARDVSLWRAAIARVVIDARPRIHALRKGRKSDH